MMRAIFRILLGPFFHLRNRPVISILLVVLIAALTVLTQVGGALLWISTPLLARVGSSNPVRRRIYQIFVFGLLYILCILLVIPLLAPLNGRVPLPWFATSEAPLRPANLGFCLLARNYVAPALRQALERTAISVSEKFPGTETQYLDANFPFLDGFPLLPHLSHNDGRKADLAFFYQDARTDVPISSPPSPIGYWAYEQPTRDEPQPCRGVHSWRRWDFAYLQPLFAHAGIDSRRASLMVKTLVNDPAVKKIIIEPHLKQRLRLSSPKVRFQVHLAVGPDSANYSLGLFDQNGELAAREMGSLTATVSPGTYYIGVSPTPDADGQYELTVN